MNRFAILLVLISLFLFSATSPYSLSSSLYPTSDATSEPVSEKEGSKNENTQTLNEDKVDESASSIEPKSQKAEKKQLKTKRKPFQKLRQLNQLRKVMKQSKRSFKENFPKIAKNKKEDGDCPDVPANKLDWRVGLALGCAIGMIVLPVLFGIAASIFSVSVSSSFLFVEVFAALSGLLAPILGLVGFFVGISALKRFSYKNDCDNYIANRKNRTVALISTVVCGFIPLALLLLVLLLILSLAFSGF